ncbi:MAG: beta-ketoacyl synthase N-terminal-like domain-containing protein [Actinoallomurus sp.]
MSAVITGLGVVAPTGIGADEHWRATLAGELAVRSIEAFDAGRYATTLAGQVPGFQAEDHVPDRLAVQTDRWTWLSFAAARLALADADYDPDDHDPYATSVVLGTGSGGNEFGQREIQALWSRGRKAVGAYQSIAWFYAASTGQMSIRYGTKGPSGVLVSDAAGGVDSLGWAERVIRRGTPTVIAGGTEAPLSPYALTCQIAGGRLSSSTDPRTGYKPFDTAANGHVPGEGGAVLIVEDAAAAAARTAPAIYGLVAGYAASHDAHHYRDAAPDGRQYARAIRQALAQAGVRPDEVDLVMADGAGSIDQDAAEASALREVFGRRGVPVTAPQGLVGRLCAGGSALNVATALLAMRAGVAPPVGNLDDPDPEYGLDLVREPREMTIKTVVVGARGHGGFNSALVLRRVDRAGRP